MSTVGVCMSEFMTGWKFHLSMCGNANFHSQKVIYKCICSIFECRLSILLQTADSPRLRGWNASSPGATWFLKDPKTAVYIYIYTLGKNTHILIIIIHKSGSHEFHLTAHFAHFHWSTAGLWKKCITQTAAGLKPFHVQGPIHRATQRVKPPLLLSDTSLAAMGKVHGSLARAGKVKNQTPKVGSRSGSRHSWCQWKISL